MNYLSYDPDTTSLEIRLDGDITEVLEKVDTIYEFRVVLEDHQGQTVTKWIKFNLTLDHDWYRNWLNPTVYKDAVNITMVQPGRIKSISVFGEVEVSFNRSSPLKPKRFAE